MPKFLAERTFNLDFLGEAWKDCFLKFSSVSIKESRALVSQKLTTKEASEVMDITLKFLQDHFISGNAYDSETKTIVSLKAEQIEELPSLIQEKLILFLVGDAKA